MSEEPEDQVWVSSRVVRLVPRREGPAGVQSVGEAREHDPYGTAPIIQVRAGRWQLCRVVSSTQAGAGPEMSGPVATITLDEGHQVVLGGTSSGLGPDRMCSKGMEPSSD